MAERSDTERLDWLEEHLPGLSFYRFAFDPEGQTLGWEVVTTITCAQIATGRTIRQAIDAAMDALAADQPEEG